MSSDYIITMGKKPQDFAQRLRTFSVGETCPKSKGNKATATVYPVDKNSLKVTKITLEERLELPLRSITLFC